MSDGNQVHGTVCSFGIVCVLHLMGKGSGGRAWYLDLYVIRGFMVVPQELVNVRDGLEEQLHTLTALLGKVEEQRILATADVEKMKVHIGGKEGEGGKGRGMKEGGGKNEGRKKKEEGGKQKGEGEK